MRKRKSYSKMLFGVIPAIRIFAGGIAYFYVHTHSADNSIIYEEGVSRQGSGSFRYFPNRKTASGTGAKIPKSNKILISRK